MSLDIIIKFIWENKEIIGLLAVIATALGALYQPTRDLLGFLPRAVWEIIKFVFLILFFITWPIRRLIVILYLEFAEKYVDKFFNKIFDWFEKREAAKEAARQPTK